MIARECAVWQPGELVRIEAIRPTNMRVVLGVTNAGKAYIKPMGGSDHGPHCLACEWVGTQLASWFGLPTLDHALMTLTRLDAEMIQEAGGRAEPGPAFVTRAVDEANPWSGDATDLAKIVNPDMIPRLVVFDTWTHNWDRSPPEGDGRRPNYDNVLLVKHKQDTGWLRMLAIDHGECFTVAQELSRHIASIKRVQEDRVFGMFPEFRMYIRQDFVAQAMSKLQMVDRCLIQSLVDGIPDEWQVAHAARTALIDLICSRAAYLADRIEDKLRFSSGELF